MMRRPFFLIPLIFLTIGCLAGGNRGVGGGLDLGGGTASSASIDNKVPAGDTEYAAAETPSGGGGSPAFGPDVLPPMADSDAVEVGTVSSEKTDKPPAAPTTAISGETPKSEGFRVIAGYQTYSTQEPTEELPPSLEVLSTSKGTTVGSLPFLVQAYAKGRWWDLIKGPTVRVVVQKSGQTPAQGRYVDFPIRYVGMKESGRGSNLIALFFHPFTEGDTVSLYLYYQPDKSAGPETHFFRKPEFYNEDANQTVEFPSAEAARKFFEDASRVHLLKTFPVSFGEEGAEVRPPAVPLPVRREITRPELEFVKP